MYIDLQNRVWSSLALTTTAVSTNAIDCTAPYTLNATQPDPSVGEPIALVVNIESAGLHVGTETYEFQVINSSGTNLTDGQLVLATTGTIATADVAVTLAAGAFVIVPVPPGSISLRYLGAKIVSANSAGVTVSAEFMPMSGIQKVKYYSTAITVH